MKHYSAEELELYRNGEMSVLGRIVCAAHLRECPECAKLLEELLEDDRLIRQLRNSLRAFQEVAGTVRFHTRQQNRRSGKKTAEPISKVNGERL